MQVKLKAAAKTAFAQEKENSISDRRGIGHEQTLAAVGVVQGVQRLVQHGTYGVILEADTKNTLVVKGGRVDVRRRIGRNLIEIDVVINVILVQEKRNGRQRLLDKESN